MSIIENAISYQSETANKSLNIWSGFINSQKTSPIEKLVQKPKSSVETLFFASAEDNGDSDLDFEILD